MAAITIEKLIEMGFVEENDGTGDPRGIDWNYRKNNYHIMVDAYCDIVLSRNNSECDLLKIQIDDLYDLENLIDFVDEIKGGK